MPSATSDSATCRSPTTRLHTEPLAKTPLIVRGKRPPRACLTCVARLTFVVQDIRKSATKERAYKREFRALSRLKAQEAHYIPDILRSRHDALAAKAGAAQAVWVVESAPMFCLGG